MSASNAAATLDLRRFTAFRVQQGTPIVSFAKHSEWKEMSSTLYDKLWEAHLVGEEADGTGLIYVDRMLIHEVSSPQAFVGLGRRGLAPRRPETMLAVPDHAVPTRNRAHIADPLARDQIAALEQNCAANGIEFIPLDDPRQGIVHVIGPELGFTLPGITLVCGDSHSATHGAFGALAFGIGTSEIECVLATQVLRQKRAKTLRISVDGVLGKGVTAKDLILAVIGQIGASGGVGYAVEYAGEAIRALSMEGRLTLCNMTIELGARVGLVAPDAVTFDYLRNCPRAPRPLPIAEWTRLASDRDARFDKEICLEAAEVAPMLTWGTSPDQVLPVTANVPVDADERVLAYMGLSRGQGLAGLKVDRVFIGSCTNGRIEDLRAAAAAIGTRQVASEVAAMVVPGSGAVKRQAEAEGLDQLFIAAGFEWREPGCSLCVAMNDDRLAPGERCASTSNRNFEGRQGIGSRTHLMSPAMAAAAALSGCIVDVRKFA